MGQATLIKPRAATPLSDIFAEVKAEARKAPPKSRIGLELFTNADGDLADWKIAVSRETKGVITLD